MMNKRNTLSLTNFTLVDDTLQLKINLNTEVYVEDDVKLRLVKNIIERMDLTELKQVYSQIGRKPTVNPVTMLEIIIFCYSEGIFSSRDIEKACRNDIRIWYLLDDQKAPDHCSINRFRNKILKLTPNLLKQMVDILIEEGQIDLSSVYIDGTKVEAYANKYTFVWRGSIEKYQEKLRLKAIEELELSENLTANQVLEILEIVFEQIEKECIDEEVEFVYGSGRKKPKLQKEYEKIKDWTKRLSNYKEHLEIMGEHRNSYSKTDHDATFMRMKDNHFRNGQLKPAYNLQLANASGFIIGENISHHPSDMYTLKPFLRTLDSNYPNSIKRLVADAGYESEENYVYLSENNFESYIKPSNYEKSKTRKYKKEQEYRESLLYDENEDKFISPEGKEFIRCKDRINTKKSGYKSITKVYRCLDWNIDGQKTKGIYISETFIKYRQKSYENITSKEGIDERLNRSIQAEGVFSKLKEGMKYDRFHHRGKENVISEINLMAMALNLNKLTSKILSNNLGLIKYKAA